MLFIGNNLECGASKIICIRASETRINISHPWGILKEEVLCAKRLGYGGWVEKLGPVWPVFIDQLYWSAPADVLMGRQPRVLWGFLYTASFCLSLTASLFLSFLGLGQADFRLHMDDLEMLYALLWVFKRGSTVTKDRTKKEFIRVTIFPPYLSVPLTFLLYLLPS